MAMNREQKRALQRQGTLAADGTPATNRDRRAPAKQVKEERTRPAEFLREVRGELKKTTWPTRQETIRLAIIVFIAILVMGAFIFAIDLAFGTFVDWMFKNPSSSAAGAAALLV